jgi:hypothetical protein
MRLSDIFERERNIHLLSAKCLFEEAIIVREQHSPMQGMDGALHK